VNTIVCDGGGATDAGEIDDEDVELDPVLDVPLSEQDHAEYRRVVASLLWLATQTRPDLCVEVRLLASHQSGPRVRDWRKRLHVLSHLMTDQVLERNVCLIDP
jgi:hypothetical protein